VRDYDLTVILNPDLAEDGVTATSEKVGGWFSTAGGQILSITSAGRKRLAYPINHQRDGTFVVFQVKTRPDSLGEVERNLKLSDDVLRYMILRK
jgi:small subunit ribosomal protein S6